MKKDIMYIHSIDEFKIKNRNVELIGETHIEFQKNIPNCLDKGYKLITEYIEEKVNDDFVLILELDEKFIGTCLDTYSTNLNLLQRLDCNKIYADVRYGINKNYQIMYDFDPKDIDFDKFKELMNLDLSVLTNFLKKSKFDSKKDKEFIKSLIEDIEYCKKLMIESVSSLKKYKKLGDIEEFDTSFMEKTKTFLGKTYPDRLHEVLQHTWKKVTDVCIIILLLANNHLHQNNVTILIGFEHVINMKKILQKYCSL